MTHRMQITLTDQQYRLLQRAAQESGAALSELIARAIDTVYPKSLDVAEKLAILEETFGVWRSHPETGEEYVNRLRSRGFNNGCS